MLTSPAALQPAPQALHATVQRQAPLFFGRFGLMSPGVRLFRSISFPAKAAWVATAFLLPILLLSGFLWSIASHNVSISATERLGVEYLRSVMPLLDAAQNRRRAATAKSDDLDEMQQRVNKTMEGLATQQQKFGQDFGTQEAWKRLQTLQQGLATHPVKDSALATFAAHTELVAAALAIIDEVADRSKLMFDPQVHSFYLVDAALFKQPQLVEQLGQVRGMGYAILRSGSIDAAQRDQMISALASARSLQAGLHKAMLRTGERAITAEATEATDRLLLTVREGVLGDKPKADAAEFLAQANQAIELYYKSITRTLDVLDHSLAERVAQQQRALWIELSIPAVGVALAAYLLVAFYRVTQGGISEVARQLQEISKGNLTLDPRPWGSDEVAQLMGTLRATLVSLRRIVGQVRADAGEIHIASAEVASASRDLARRTEETGAQLQRTSAAMTQIGATVRQTAETAKGAAELVDRNADVAGRGGQVVGEVVNTMAGIRESSGRIGDIIGTIDSIAFQTNILALNAAVEAARAGEAGRGFAVVASEVRGLAQRSSAAAREIKALISTSVSQVESGSKVVGQAGDTMRDVVDNAEQVKILISEISHGAAEQTAGVHDVSRSVEQLDAMAQQNAALVEQTAAAAASLKDNAARLHQEMAFFRLP